MTQDIFKHWKNDEFGFCRRLVAGHGHKNVSYDPKNVASYLRLQASSAFRDGEYEISARLGTAATAINEDARNDHAPNWAWAGAVMGGGSRAVLYTFPISIS